MRERENILLLGLGAEGGPLAKRLRLLGFTPLVAETPEALRRERERLGDALRVAVAPLRPADPTLDPAAGAFAGGAAEGLRLVVTGPTPEPGERAALREAGVELALFEPFDDGTLRFVLNEALRDDERHRRRESVRVPSSALARVVSASGAKSAFVYSLSVGGAFLETHRPTAPRGRLRVEIILPERRVVAQAVVVQTNVPGNLQRGNVPLGMGVRFEALGSEDREALERHIAERSAAVHV